jgi:hypothetical protein
MGESPAIQIEGGIRVERRDALIWFSPTNEIPPSD